MVKDTSDTADVKEPAGTAEDLDLGKTGMDAMQDGDEPLAPGEEFDINDWSGYPKGPKPNGPFRLVEGEEYDRARADANAANHQLHLDNPSLQGKEIHEIKPVKFGGSPTDIDNKMALTHKQHQEYTTWWNRKQAELTGE